MAFCAEKGMRIMRLFRHQEKRPWAGLLACVLGICALPAGAATISYTDSYTENYPNVDGDWDAYTDWGTGGPNDPIIYLHLEKFYTGLGTLTGVEIRLNGVVQGAWYVDNDASNAKTITGTLKALLTLELPSGYSKASTLSVTPSVSRTFAADADNGDGDTPDFTAPDGNEYTGLSASASSSTSSTAASDLALFTSATEETPLNLSIVAYGESTDSGGGNLTSYFDTYAGAEAEVIYTYIAVPEPGAGAVCTGLVALGSMLVYRRQRRDGAGGKKNNSR
jgi:hypothetical protein